MNTSLRSAVGVAVLALGVGLVSAACAKEPHCEHDATDTKVSNHHCEVGTPGYEWEPDNHKTKTKKTKTNKTVIVDKRAHRR
ncbi:hypothetical protein IU485_27515 [Nocardia cyriacigeorgica]|uniref:hypothetical protein n=1 Tax=Nocardia cyriacigeorgica TaxID=135487 RepID=UPI001895FA3D|nr:hypothetical protein [Nocardia cyriacigeorgica]MBF6085125.1 hypothetical protein [Nocardia cyriacigeorgica]